MWVAGMIHLLRMVQLKLCHLETNLPVWATLPPKYNRSWALVMSTGCSEGWEHWLIVASLASSVQLQKAEKYHFLFSDSFPEAVKASHLPGPQNTLRIWLEHSFRCVQRGATAIMARSLLPPLLRGAWGPMIPVIPLSYAVVYYYCKETATLVSLKLFVRTGALLSLALICYGHLEHL